MIVRISEALLAPGMTEEFMLRLNTLVRDFPSLYDGLISHEVLVDRADPLRVSYVSRWRDESSLVAYAGANWASDPVTFPEEDRFLREPLALRHFVTVEID